LGETLWSEMKDVGVDVTTLLAGSMPSPGYDRYVARFDPRYATGMGSEDLLVVGRAQMFHPVPEETAANALYDALPEGPICFSRSTDEQLGLATLTLPRREAIALWRGVQETPLRQ
jgi:hypothetical protein